jgi:hypothetical protein
MTIVAYTSQFVEDAANFCAKRTTPNFIKT